MLDRWNVFLQTFIDFAWVTEMLIVSLAWVIVCHGLKWEKEKILRRILQIVLIGICLAAVNTICFVVLEYYGMLIPTIVKGVVFAIYMRLCSGYGKKANMIIFCSMYAGVCALSVIAGQVSFLTGDYIMRGYPEGIARCLVYLLMLPLALYLRRFNFDEYKMLPSSGMLLIISGDVSLLALHVVESLWAGQDYRVTITLLGAYTCILIMVLAAVRAMHSLCAEQSEILSLQAEKQRLIAEQESMKMVESNLEDLRCLRHDLKNQYAYMQILLQEKRFEELKEYFQQIAENLPPQLNYIDCGNRSMNTILNMEIGKAKNAHIDVTHQFVVPPVLPFPEDDLCAVVANLMDNAIEASAGMENPAIHLSIYPQKSYLFIMCRNTTHLDKIERRGWGLRTTKSDDKIHGYGTRIVTKTAEKYNGCAEFSLEDGYFVAKVMLDMMEGTNHANQNCAV